MENDWDGIDRRDPDSGKTTWGDVLVEFICLLIMIAFVFACLSFILFPPKNAHGADLSCMKTCELDIMDVEQCIEEEKSYWEISNATDKTYRKHCEELIANEIYYCQIECILNSYPDIAWNQIEKRQLRR